MCIATTKTGSKCKLPNAKSGNTDYCHTHQPTATAVSPPSLFASIPTAPVSKPEPSDRPVSRSPVMDLINEDELELALVDEGIEVVHQSPPVTHDVKRQAAMDGSGATAAAASVSTSPPLVSMGAIAAPASTPYYVAATADGSAKPTTAAHRNSACTALVNFSHHGSVAVVDLTTPSGGERKVCKKCANWSGVPGGAAGRGGAGPSAPRTPKKLVADIPQPFDLPLINPSTGVVHTHLCPSVQNSKHLVAATVSQYTTGKPCRCCDSWNARQRGEVRVPKTKGVPAASVSSVTSPASSPLASTSSAPSA